MQIAPRIPEIGQRDRFVKRIVTDGRVITLSDEAYAKVTSNRFPDRAVHLFWSSPKEAKRWAEALTGEDRTTEIALKDFATSILSEMIADKALVGTDWVADPIEAEVEAADLLIRLKTEAATGFLRALNDQGHVFIVEGEGGPQVANHVRRGDGLKAVQIFAARGEAEWAMKKTGGKKVMADPIADFLSSTLPWAIARGHAMLMEPIPGAGALDLTPEALGQRLLAASLIQPDISVRRDARRDAPRSGVA